MEKTTKESLIIELAKLKQTHAGLVSDDEYKRKEFAKAFNWKEGGMYGYGGGDHKPSWEEIFVEVGRLLGKQQRLDYIFDTENLKLKIQKVENDLQNLELKNEK